MPSASIQKNADISPCTMQNRRNNMQHVAERFGIPFHLFPITKETKEEQEKKEMELLVKHKVNFIVLARYMQVISGKMIDAYPSTQYFFPQISSKSALVMMPLRTYTRSIASEMRPCVQRSVSLSLLLITSFSFLILRLAYSELPCLPERPQCGSGRRRRRLPRAGYPRTPRWRPDSPRRWCRH